ncbi:MAG TPA: cyclic nucleotide-binding domain-containing protein [Acidobacteriota bacterium]|nr:cyclic nucleotide-binding domain-containing protein [Acidobacteriota bacterium]
MDEPRESSSEETISADEFCDLANKLADQKLYDEAIALFQTASRIFPDSLALKLNLGRALELQRREKTEQQRTSQLDSPNQETLIAQQTLSLATLYYSRKKLNDAMDLLALSKLKNAHISKTHFLLGKIFYEQGEHEKAIGEFLKVKEADPFYEENYKFLASLYYEKQNLDKSLEAWIDAYILSGGEDVAKNSYYQRQIRNLLTEMGLQDKTKYHRLFDQKRQHFLKLASSLSVKNDDAPQKKANLDPILLRYRDVALSGRSSLNLALELKKFAVMQGFTDEELVLLARITTERPVQRDEVIIKEDDLTEGVYFIHSGSVRIVKQTPFGEQLLTSLGEGEFFGEMDFIDSLHSSADAIAIEESVLFSLSKAKLEELFREQKQLAVQFYWHFWKTLSQRVRETNERLKSFFIEAKEDQARKKSIESEVGESVTVDLQKKLAVLKDKGLSSKELSLLAAFSKEEFYKEGQTIFVEGDRGDKLYIILDGEVRISKYIPGVGEEALAILGRGDFFGEMALIDNAPRSADAKAHQDVTVLPIESRLLNEILAKDVMSSYQFLYIICKILSRRLREINQKIYQWRVMSGGF